MSVFDYLKQRGEKISACEQKEIKIFNYFVSYFYREKYETGIGNVILGTSKKINTEKAIREAEEVIKKRSCFTAVVILNFKLLEAV